MHSENPIRKSVQKIRSESFRIIQKTCISFRKWSTFLIDQKNNLFHIPYQQAQDQCHQWMMIVMFMATAQNRRRIRKIWLCQVPFSIIFFLLHIILPEFWQYNLYTYTTHRARWKEKIPLLSITFLLNYIAEIIGPSEFMRKGTFINIGKPNFKQKNYVHHSCREFV